MKLHSLFCPNCNASLDVEDGIDTFYCKYCGFHVILEGQSDEIIKAKVELKNQEHQEKMADKKHEQERYRNEQKNKRLKINSRKKAICLFLIIAAFATYFIAFDGYFASKKRASDNEEAKLQTIVEDIMVDIDRGYYDEAYVKANSLHYTSGWSSEIEDKWDDTREAILDKIKENEKKAKKEASKNDGIWGLF